MNEQRFATSQTAADLRHPSESDWIHPHFPKSSKHLYTLITGASDNTILGALLHDIGHQITPADLKAVGAAKTPHAAAAAAAITHHRANSAHKVSIHVSADAVQVVDALADVADAAPGGKDKAAPGLHANMLDDNGRRLGLFGHPDIGARFLTALGVGPQVRPLLPSEGLTAYPE